MTSQSMYHDGNRRLQDAFDSRRLADRLEEKLTRTSFTDDNRAFIESVPYFFLATADTEGRPDCSFKGGAPGFVQITAPDELVFKDRPLQIAIGLWALAVVVALYVLAKLP